MLGWIAWVGGGLVVTLIALMVVVVVGIRRGNRKVMSAMWKLQKRYLNPMAMKKAGGAGEYSVIEHVGRRSGRAYRTPVGVTRHGNDYIVALPYGTHPDWVRNVLSAGTANLIHEGETVAVTGPETIPVAENPEIFSKADRRAQKIFGIDRALRLRVAVKTVL